jgi:hypothetical protein
MQIEETKKKKKGKIESSDNNTSLKSKKKYRKQVKISLHFWEMLWYLLGSHSYPTIAYVDQ